MINMDKLLDIVYTEGVTGITDEEDENYRIRKQQKPDNLPPIQFNLELIANPDGTLEWVE